MIFQAITRGNSYLVEDEKLLKDCNIKHWSNGSKWNSRIEFCSANGTTQFVISNESYLTPGTKVTNVASYNTTTAIKSAKLTCFPQGTKIDICASRGAKWGNLLNPYRTRKTKYKFLVRFGFIHTLIALASSAEFTCFIVKCTVQFC